MRTVYLAGLISTHAPESLAWRLKAEEALSGAAEVLTPLRGKENLFKETNDGGVTSNVLTASDVILRDYRDIRRSDVILANLELFGSDRPLLGTIMELAWAWDYKIPVVAIARPVNILMRTHPFISSAVSHYVHDLDAAVDILVKHYLR